MGQTVLLSLFGFVLLGSIIAVCGQPFKAVMIIRGRAAKRNEFYYQIALLDAERKPYCGGAIISEKYCVTAAHCKDEDYKKATVLAGGHSIKRPSGTEQERKIKEFIIHHEYNENKFAHDVGLIQVDKSFVFNNFVKAVKLHKDHVYPSGKITVSGWGYTAGFDPDSIPDLLQTAVLDVRPYKDCLSMWKGKVDFPSQCFCADVAGKGIDICDGDSGGPATMKVNDEYVLYGVVNFSSNECAQPNEPAAFLRISSYVDWISKIMQNPQDAPKSQRVYHRDHHLKKENEK